MYTAIQVSQTVHARVHVCVCMVWAITDNN